MVKKRNLFPLLSFSALLVCILPHCRLRDWCGNLRKASGHVVCRLDQSASFRISDSTFYFPHSAIPHLTHSHIKPNRTSMALIYPDQSRTPVLQNSSMQTGSGIIVYGSSVKTQNLRLIDIVHR